MGAKHSKRIPEGTESTEAHRSKEERHHRPRKQNKRRHLQQVKRDLKRQRVTKEQLYRLSFELQRTPWYLGRCLGFKENVIRRISYKFETDQEQKFQILLRWKSRAGLKANIQTLVIFLELGGYEYEEYKSVIMSSGDDTLSIYDKPPDLRPKKEDYRYEDYDITNLGPNLDKKVDDDCISVDFALFLRKSWKMPQIKENKDPNVNAASVFTEDSGIVMSQTLSHDVTDNGSGNRESDTNSSSKKLSNGLIVRRCSDSTLNYSITASSQRLDSDSELNRTVGAAHLFGVDSNDDGPILAAPLFHHGHQQSTDSQIQTYRNEIARMSKRHYEVISKAGRANSNYNYYTMGGEGTIGGKFKDKISGLALTRAEDIVVADSDNKRIQIFDKRGRFKRCFDTNTALKPKGIFVTKQDSVLVCCGNEIREFSTDGELMKSFGRGTFRNNSYSVCCDAFGHYYVTDIVGHTVSVYDEKGNIRKRFGRQGSTLLNFDQPVALAISAKGDLYISDTQNHTIKVYSLAGRPIHAIGAKGIEDGKLWNPFGICFDANGLLYVADCGNNRISVFDQNYKFVRHILTARDGLQMPSFVQVNSSSQLIVSEWNAQEIKIFSLETAV